MLLGLQQLVIARAQLTRETCFTAWAADGETHEVVDVLGLFEDVTGPPLDLPEDPHSMDTVERTTARDART